MTGLDLHYPDGSDTARQPKFEAVKGDFRDRALMDRLLEDVHVVFHLASAHLQIRLPESEYWDVNVHSLPALLETAEARGVERFVHVSSVGVYGQLAQCPADEQTPPHPQSVYGRTKLEGERIVLDYTRRTGFPVVVLRPAWVYGSGCPRTEKIYRALRKRRFPMIGRCTNLRHPVYIDDFVTACDLAAEKDDLSGEVFIVGGERAITSQELIETWCQALDLPQPALRIPLRLARVMAFAAEASFGLLGKEPPLSRRTLEFFNTDNAFCIAKARAELHYHPKFDLACGLERTRPWLERICNR